MLKKWIGQAGGSLSAAPQCYSHVATRRRHSAIARVDSSQRGDTIVEVLITIAIISTVLVGAYISTNKDIASTQDAQERTQATKLVETQIESLRSAHSLDPSQQCFSGGSPASGAPCNVTPNGSGSQPAYKMTVTANVTGIYTIVAQWEAITGVGTNNVTMQYRPLTL